MTKVEEVARAMHAEFGRRGYGDYTYPWDSPLASKDMFIHLARAAIEAMRISTYEMDLAGDAEIWNGSNAAHTYWVMITAALSTPANAPDTPVKRGNGEGR